jgi:hypothetical protein
VKEATYKKRLGGGRLALGWALVVLLALLPARVGLAQPAGLGGGLSGGEIDVQVEKFGVGNIARKGDWAGIRLKLQDTTSKQRELLVRIDGLDPDGDTPQYERIVTSNPGVWQGLWMYVRLPFALDSTNGLSASVYEAVEVSGERSVDYPTGYKPGRRLGYLPITPQGTSLAKDTDGMLGMMGQRDLGLQLYMGGQGSFGEAWHPQGHERSDIVLGITPADLPDRWMGLRELDALVWGQGDPAELRGERAVAVREWVKRGGHLIIILPGVGQTWTNPASNDLIDIMPTVSVARKEVADLSGYRDLVMRRKTDRDEPDRPFPKSGIVHTFKPLPDAQPGEAMRILNNPEGECIVARRLVGAGAVTMIGLDLNQTAFSQFQLVDADVFWHRILGRRGSLEPPKQSQGQRPNFQNSLTNRHAWLYDQDIPSEISKKGAAAGGVLIGFVVFVLYWLVAGPLGFGLLKFRRWAQHAWVSFVLAAAVFTAISWTGATTLRQKDVDARHLTLLDHVYGQPIQRARMWADVMIPKYGTARIAITPPDEDATGKRSVNALTSWDSPVPDSAGWGGFPDVRGYAVDTRAPDVLNVPSRQTVKQIEADWAGGPAWEMPRPLRVDEPGGIGKLILHDPNVEVPAPGKLPAPMIEGSLVHKMPGPLKNIVVVVVRRQTYINGNASSLPLCQAIAVKYVADWKPGESLDLGLITRPSSSGQAWPRLESYLADLKPAGSMDFTTSGVNDEREKNRAGDRLMALAFFSEFDPPRVTGDSASQYAAQRAATHSWDLSMWFTQPCVIIVGELDGPTPVPLTVDGQPVKSDASSKTIVRWIYPLPDNPPEYSRVGETEKQQAAEPAIPEPEKPASPDGVITTYPNIPKPPQ